MSHSYSDIWIHAVWATKNREPILRKEWRILLFQYIFRKGKELGIQIDFVNGVEDHVHILLKMKTTDSIAVIMKQLKGLSSYWINQQHILPDALIFSWQRGYGAISVSPDRVEVVRNYIRNQEKHHRQYSKDQIFGDFL